MYSFTGLGFTFSVISMTGYFAYLYIHRFGISLFRSFWPMIQILLIAFVLFDLVYFPYRGSDGELGNLLVNPWSNRVLCIFVVNCEAQSKRNK